MVNKRKLVIIGGGFGGLYLLKNLTNFIKKKKDIEFYLVDKNDYFLFTPLLDEILVGNIPLEAAICPFDRLFKKSRIKFIQAEVNLVNIEENFIVTSRGNIYFDYLVIALGSCIDFYNIEGAKEFSFNLKSLPATLKLKERILNLKRDEKIAIIGGGATGVQVAYKIKIFLEKKNKQTEVILIEKGERLLSNFSEKISQKAFKILQKQGIKIFLRTGIDEIKENEIRLNNDEIINKVITIWTAGVRPNVPKFSQNIILDEKGRIVVDEFFKVKNYNHVFALGDIISMENKIIPLSAQSTVKEAKFLAENFKNYFKNKTLRNFIYYHAGDLIPLKRFYTLGEIRKITIFGFIPWLAWKLIYIIRSVSWQQRWKLIANFFNF